MLDAIVGEAHKPPNFWLQIGAFHLAMAVIVAALFGLGTRSLLLAALDWNAHRKSALLRAAKGDAFLLLGVFYALFAWPMLEWDRAARFVAALTMLGPPLVAVIRRAKGWAPAAPKFSARLLSGLLTLVLFVAAGLTLLRAGFITLAGDRVPLLLDVTGETAGGNSGRATASGERPAVAHHVILWLPSGAPVADLWITSDRIAFAGRAVLFSPRLNALGFPNLYQFLSVRGVRVAPGMTQEFLARLPQTGPLAIHPLWRPFQAAMLRAWPRAPAGAWPIWGVRSVENQSPFYPLDGPDGQPLKQHFLLDLTLEGVATSRGSSPLEK